MSCTYTSMYFAGFLNFADTFFVHGFLRGNFIILFGLNVFFECLNWFYYILSKASDLHCIVNKSFLASPKSWIASPSQVPSQSGKLQVKSQVTKTATRVGLESKSPDSSLHLCNSDIIIAYRLYCLTL